MSITVLLAILLSGCEGRETAGAALPAVRQGPLAVGVSSVPSAVRAGSAFRIVVHLRNLSSVYLAVPVDLSPNGGFGILRLHGPAGLERREGIPPENTFLAPAEVSVLAPGEDYSTEVAVPASLTSRLTRGDYALVAGLVVPRGVTEDTGMLFHGAAYSHPVAVAVRGAPRR